MKQSPLIYIMYDSIYNTVFAGQVVEPLRSIKEQNPQQPIILVSFETKKPSLETIERLIPATHGITTYFCKKIPCIGFISLRIAAYQLKLILRHYGSYHIQTRSPLAALISIYAYNKKRCLGMTIQARGLLAAEYAYVHQHNNSGIIYQYWHAWRTNMYERIERYVYSKAVLEQQAMPIIIEAISIALQQHLIDAFGTPAEIITVAHADSQVISVSEKQYWRNKRRQELAIPEQAQIYCYSGSAHTWQCPEETIVFFKEQYTASECYLLILTPDHKPFIQLLNVYKIPSSAYRLLTVPHHQVFTYLAASDGGILFRKHHLINWVARPTKALEYKAARLSLIHNNTVACLIKNGEHSVPVD